MRDSTTEGANRLFGFSTLFYARLQQVAVAGLLCAFLPPAVAAETAPTLSEPLLNEISALSEQGAESLSMQLLAGAEPDLEKDPQAWATWQRKKIELLRQKEQWQAIIHEYEALPANVSATHRDWVMGEVIQTYLTMGSGAQARDLLLPLIWNGKHDPEQLAEWRRLVVQSYLVDGRYEDARAAVLRYEQDYPDAEQNPQWLGLKARLQIATGHANEAAILAVVSDAAPARSAYVLARMKGLSMPEVALVDEAFKWLADPTLDLTFKQSLFNALFEKSRQIEGWPRRIAVLERLLDVKHLEVAQVTAVVDALWFSLAEYGRQLANQHQLLVGNFRPWFELAAQLDNPNKQQAEALYAWLAIRAKGDDINTRAHELLVQTLSQKGETGLMRSLYLSSSQFTDVGALPLALMYRLVDMALAGDDLALASKLMSGLDAPKGVDLVEWQLRRARVQIQAGVPQRGAGLLKEIVSAASLSDGQIVNLLLATRDLAHQGDNETAYAILADLLHKVPDSRRQGELYYWMGESRRAQQQYTAAARLYLHAARLAGKAGAGWRALARRRAAQMLEQAGLKNDAATLYRQLLPGADAAHRALYQDHIRQLASHS